MKTCVYPGSFNPPTVGHMDIIMRAARLFDRVVVAVMDNGQKRYTVTSEARAEMLRKCTEGMPCVDVLIDDGLSASLAKRLSADAIIRGVRGEEDIASESLLAAVNRHLENIETVFLFANPEHSFINSMVVRNVALHGGCLNGMVPEEIRFEIEKLYGSHE